MFLISVKDVDCVKYLIHSDAFGKKILKILAKYFVGTFVSLYSVTLIYTVADNFYRNGYLDSEELYYPYIVPW